MGIVYVLTNTAMPGLVKIGMTDDQDANSLIGQLYTSGVPLPFEVQYACRVDNPLEVEARFILHWPHRINPKREFFRVDSTQVIASCACLTGLTRPPKWRYNQPMWTRHQWRPPPRRECRPNLDFVEMGIPIGLMLEAVSNPDITVVVISAKKVKLGEEEVSTAGRNATSLGDQLWVRPTPLWRYQGRLLSEIDEETYSALD